MALILLRAWTGLVLLCPVAHIWPAGSFGFIFLYWSRPGLGWMMAFAAEAGCHPGFGNVCPC